jgi:hypothetical protein
MPVRSTDTADASCPGPVTRREWLRVGSLSLGALAAGMPPSLTRLLAADAASDSAAGAAATGAARQVDRDFSVILFWANGGPSHIDLFDLKPHAPAEYRGPFRPIPTQVQGMEITELLPRLAGLGEKLTLLRSLYHERNQHSGGTHRFLTGYSSRQANLASSENPELGSVVARSLEGKRRDVPPFVGNTQFYGGGPAYLGPAYAPYMPHANNPISASGNNTYDPIPIYSDADDLGTLTLSEAMADGLTRRVRLLGSLDRMRREVDQSGLMDSLDSLNRQALSILASPRTRNAFDLSREAESTRRRYGQTHWGRSLLTCRRLVEAGVRFVQCQATFRLRPETGRVSTWDDHSVNSHIFRAYEEKLPSLDQSVSALVEDLYERGLDRHVLFVFCGEFGRTPRIRNQDASGRPGRDHWPQAMSVLLAGGGLRTGQVVGATNSRAEYPVERVMDSNCLLATIYERFGIDTARSFLDHSGRPLPILPQGEPIAELL